MLDLDAVQNEKAKQSNAGPTRTIVHQNSHQLRVEILIKKAHAYCSFLAKGLEERQKELREGPRPEPEAPVPVVAVEDKASSSSESTIRVTKQTRCARKRKSKDDSNSKNKRQKGLLTTPPAVDIPPPRTTRQPTMITGGMMREYQLVGTEWLVSLYENGLNGILADEMGLGKTLQCIAFLAHLWEMGTRGPFLIVAPLSTMPNWIAEINRWAPDLPVLMYHGDKEERAWLRRHKMDVNNNFPIIVTTYEISMRDRKYLQMYAWKYVIVDEGHRLKNLDCKLIRELKSYPTANRLLLTGTPLQNKISELWSLLNFVMPEVFKDRVGFENIFQLEDPVYDLSTSETQQEFMNRQTQTSFITQLHDILKPFLLRRVKSEVELTLPKKREYLVYAPLTLIQKELYEAAMKGELRETISELLMREKGCMKEAEEDGRKRARLKNYAEVEDDNVEDANEEGVELGDEKEEKDAVKERGKQVAIDIALKTQKLQSRIMQLRKICNHPFLFNLGLDEPLNPENSTSLPAITTYSGKMLLLERLLPKLFERGHKVLLFSQMTRVLNIIEEWCTVIKKWDICRLDGSVSFEDRRDAIEKFQTTSSTSLFLLSTRAGGLGINLAAADTVIIFDSDWNPQMDNQAMDRVHRIGQTRVVVVYRLVCGGTVEERVLERARGKRKLGDVIIHKDLFKGRVEDFTSQQRIADDDLAAILRHEDGMEVRGISTEQANDPEYVLSDQDLERILAREWEEGRDSEATQGGQNFRVLEEVEDGLGGIAE